MKLAALAALALFATASTAAPLLDGNRIAVGVGGSYEWHGGTMSPAPPKRSEIAVNGFGAYALILHSAAVVRVAYGAGNRTVRLSPGAHYNLKVGTESFAAGLTYDFYAGDFDPAFPNEWVVSGIYSRPLGKSLTLSLVDGWGFSNHENRVSAQLTAPLFVGKERD